MRFTDPASRSRLPGLRHPLQAELHNNRFRKCRSSGRSVSVSGAPFQQVRAGRRISLADLVRDLRRRRRLSFIGATHAIEHGMALPIDEPGK